MCYPPAKKMGTAATSDTEEIPIHIPIPIARLVNYLLSSSTCMSASDNGSLGGHPSITHPTPPPCDSPNVVTRNTVPYVFPVPARTSAPCKQTEHQPPTQTHRHWERSPRISAIVVRNGTTANFARNYFALTLRSSYHNRSAQKSSISEPGRQIQQTHTDTDTDRRKEGNVD